MNLDNDLNDNSNNMAHGLLDGNLTQACLMYMLNDNNIYEMNLDNNKTREMAT